MHSLFEDDLPPPKDHSILNIAYSKLFFAEFSVMVEVISRIEIFLWNYLEKSRV